MVWDEAEYVALLHGERRRYAWVLRRYGQYDPAEADALAARWYDYEPPEDPHRGLVFHDEAWHWAMLHLHGDRYAADHPELAFPPPEYDAPG